jgi:hypothetical protein
VNAPAFTALAATLDEIAAVAAQLTPSVYADSDVPGVSGSIGGHVRHCLDHVRALERGLESGLIDYDVRSRESSVERSREHAVLALTAAARRLERIPDGALPRPVVVRTTIDVRGRVVLAASSLGRELAFVLSHTIHHASSMALLAHGQGCRRLPDRFGLAPATPTLAGAA